MSSQRPRLVKVGGAYLDNYEYLQALARYLKRSAVPSEKTILVHGGGKEISKLQEALGTAVGREHGLRVTSEAEIDSVTMVLCGLVNKRIVAHLNIAGLKTFGVCGADLGIMKAGFLNFERLGRVGGPPEVDIRRLRDLLSATDVLAVAPVCVGSDGALVNVNADSVAQAVAVSLGVECLEFITDVAGVRTSEGELRTLLADQVEDMIQDAVVEGGMIPKLQASVAALGNGVRRVRVGSIESLSRGFATEVATR